MTKRFIAAALVVVFSTMPAMALDWSTPGAHIVAVEASYVPNAVTFRADAAAGSSCPAGAWLQWNGQGPDQQAQRDNVKAVFALLLAAKLSGKTVNLYGNNPTPGTTTCLVTNIHLD